MSTTPNSPLSSFGSSAPGGRRMASRITSPWEPEGSGDRLRQRLGEASCNARLHHLAK